MLRTSFNGTQFKRPPGPGGIPLLGSLFEARRDPLGFALNLTRDYGDICHFRIGIYTGYLLNHPNYFKHVLQSNHRNYDKENYNYRMLRPVLGNGLITASGKTWLQHRRLMQPVFHQKEIGRFGSTVISITREMMQRWESEVKHKRPIPVSAELMLLTFRVITESLFGTDVVSSAEIVRNSFATLNRDIAYRFTNVFVPPLWVPTRRNRKFKKSVVNLDRLVHQIIESRRAEGSERRDLLGMLLSAKDEDSGERMTDQQLRDEVMTLMLAGHETTANLLTWTCYLLSQHAEVMWHVKSELDNILQGDDPDVNDLQALDYMDSVLQEALRMYPPVWIISRNVINRDLIGEYSIPAGSTVVLCPFVLHRHEAYWESPETFRPERFSTKEGSGVCHPAYFPFGGGPRYCLGSHLALMESKLILATILSRFQLKLVPGHKVEPEPLITLRPRYGLKMKLQEW